MQVKIIHTLGIEYEHWHLPTELHWMNQDFLKSMINTSIYCRRFKDLIPKLFQFLWMEGTTTRDHTERQLKNDTNVFCHLTHTRHSLDSLDWRKVPKHKRIHRYTCFGKVHCMNHIFTWKKINSGIGLSAWNSTPMSDMQSTDYQGWSMAIWMVKNSIKYCAMELLRTWKICQVVFHFQI